MAANPDSAPVYAAVIDSPVGRLGVGIEANAVASIDWVPAGVAVKAPADPLTRRVVGQLQDYFADPAHHRFDLPLVPAPTAFQARVRAALEAIAPGRVQSYGDLARELGSSARAVGGACRANPVPLIVPCHRVVSAHGLGGFGGMRSGERLTVKRQLLEGEGGICASIT